MEHESMGIITDWLSKTKGKERLSQRTAKRGFAIGP